MASDPRFAPGQVVDGRLICGAKNKAGNPCGLGPVPGATRCGRHGGKAPQVQAKAERVLAEQKAKNIMSNAVRTLGLPVDIDPAQALKDEIAVTYGHVQWLRAKVQELTPEDLVWGKDKHEDGVGPQGVVDVTTEKAGPSVWYSMYLTEREHLVKVTTAALRAGIQERQIKLAEEQGQLVFVVIRRIMDAALQFVIGFIEQNRADLASETLKGMWRAMEAEVVPRELRSLATENK